jgi:multisubunit Na+/H+ antiporter MnhC subunit
MTILYIIGAVLFIFLVFFLLKKLIKLAIILLLIGACIFLYYRYKGSTKPSATQRITVEQPMKGMS